jgi:hypothetical protein
MDSDIHIAPASCISSCFRLMICSGLVRNRSHSPVVFGNFGRIGFSDATTESRLAITGIPETETVSFRSLSPGSP